MKHIHIRLKDSVPLASFIAKHTNMEGFFFVEGTSKIGVYADDEDVGAIVREAKQDEQFVSTVSVSKM